MDERRRQRRQQRILEAGQSRLSKITGNEYCIEHKTYFVCSIDFFLFSGQNTYCKTCKTTRTTRT